jgi:hypothetical protein
MMRRFVATLLFAASLLILMGAKDARAQTMCPDGTGPATISKPYEPTAQGSYCDVRGSGARPHKGVDMMQSEGYLAPIPPGCNIMMNGDSPLWCQGDPDGVGGYGHYMRFSCGYRTGPDGKQYHVEVRYAHIKGYDANSQRAIVSCSGCVGITPHVHYETLVEGRKVNPVCVWGEGISNNVSCPAGLSQPANLCDGNQLKILHEQACFCPGFGCGGPGATTSMNYHDGVDPNSLSGNYGPKNNSSCSGQDDSGGTPTDAGNVGGGGGGGGGGGEGEGPTSGQGEGDPNPNYQENEEGCYSCCCPCTQRIINNHKRIRRHVDIFGRDDEQSEFEEHRNWMVYTFLQQHILPAMMMMTSQLTAVGIEQVRIIGTFLDAKNQLETQRLFQQLAARAHKDYHPSEGMCEVGTAARSLLASERRADLAQMTIAQHGLKRQVLSGDTLAAEGGVSDLNSRRKQFIETYCDKKDNVNGLNLLCKDGGGDAARQNRDVDYNRTIESKLTANYDFSPTSTAADPDAEDLFALAANLYSHELAPKKAPTIYAPASGNKVRLESVHLLMDLRALFAKRSVAMNSFAAIAGQRADGDAESAPFVKRLVAELGIAEDQVEDIIGKNPSYFAQMEVLSKKIYENPTFYTELYDKPANINRKAVALKAIGMMQDRDIYQSLLRSEMLGSVLLETMLAREQDSLEDTVRPETQKAQPVLQNGGSP